MRKEYQSCVTIFASLTILVSVTMNAFAASLSDEDYAYLKTQYFARNEPPLVNLSPKERSNLHNLINDPRTSNDPAVRDKNVKDALDISLKHQL
jgi:hypothetical protein